MKMTSLKKGDTVLLNNGEEVTIEEIARPPRFTQNSLWAVTLVEYPNALFFYNNYGNVTGRLNKMSITEKLEPKRYDPQQLMAIDIPLMRADSGSYMRLLRDCFGLHRNDIPRPMYDNYSEKITLVCRPDQFARFIVERNLRGGQNMIKELNARYVETYRKDGITLIFVAENI